MNREKMNKMERLISNFNKAKIGVIGDIVADFYVYGKPFKLSREAPVLVIRHDGEKIIPGSAGNTINNLACLEANVYPVGIIGNDKEGEAVINCFAGKKVVLSGIVKDRSWVTISKTRIMAGDDNTSKQQVIRIDREPMKKITTKMEKRIISNLKDIAGEIDALIVADYSYNLITPVILKEILAIARKKIVVVDSHHQLKDFKGVHIVTPNQGEAEEATGITIKNDRDLEQAGEKLLKGLKSKAVLITRGNAGMALFEVGKNMNKIPIFGRDDITDVTGAGDTVTSVLTLALVAGASLIKAAYLANYGASVVVMKRGTATLTGEELLKRIKKDE
ncbi:MAG: PfkB family carbohydrate kinase [Thermodesulfobacteriota bacterium]|nr:PfkB family carbohydrate kinase [Thermodesulfobacteriota bacterium]